MKLLDLNPRFFSHGGEGVRNRDGDEVPYRSGVGILFDCPCGCGDTVALNFENPVDGGQRVSDPAWYRDGLSFEMMTLSPSIQRVGGCTWRGWIRDGQIVNA